MHKQTGLAVAMLLSGCAVGPNYYPPVRPATKGYITGYLAERTQSIEIDGGEAQRFHLGQDLPGEWWTMFQSPALNKLISRAMVNYPNILAQQAAVRTAEENVRAQVGSFLPNVAGSLAAQRNKTSGGKVAPGFPGFFTNIYSTNLNISYAPDLFGGQRRTHEQLKALAQQQRFRLEASYLTLSFNVASTAIQLAGTVDQLDAIHQIVTLEEKQLSVIQRLVQLGSQTNAELLQQKASLASVRATLSALEQQKALAEHQLAILTGRFPHDMTPLELKLADLKLPEDLPVSLPSALVAQRPDIRAQEAALNAASAAIGIATANMLPQLTLTGSFGGEALLFGSLLEPDSNTLSVSGQLAQPLVDGGALRAKRRAAFDAFAETEAQYHLTVLSAFQSVADTLTALDNDAQALTAQNDAVADAKAGLDLIQKEYDMATANYVLLLTAQQAYQQARLAYVRVLQSRYADTVSLFQALGGGWWNRKDPGVFPMHP